MSNIIKKAQLETYVNIINARLGLTPTTGEYMIEYVSGGCILCKRKTFGENEQISAVMSKRELYIYLSGMHEGVYA